MEELGRGGYECSIITTFNAYLPFYEEVVLRRMISNGVRHNLLLMDHAQCVAALEQAPPRLNGRHYTLLPVLAKGAFHPKILLLLGKKRGILIVGSHNLTLSGFGLNGELTNIVRFEVGKHEDSLPIFWQAWEALSEWVEQLCGDLPSTVNETLPVCRQFAPWLKNTETTDDNPVQFLASMHSQPSLWSQCLRFIPEQPSRTTIFGAFFDRKLTFVNTLREELTPAECIVGVQAKTVEAPRGLLTQKDLHVVDSSVLLEAAGKKDDSGYLHAKGILIEDDTKQILITGSANPSAPAWLPAAGQGNIEAVLLRQGPEVAGVSNALGLSKLAAQPVVQELPPVIPHDNDNASKSSVTLLMGYAKEGGIHFKLPPELSAKALMAELYNADHTLITACPVIHSGDKNVRVEVSAAEFDRCQFAKLFSDNSVLATLLIHFEALINERAATGLQRKFRDAFGLLSTDDPNIDLVFRCFDQVMDSVDEEIASIQRPQRSGKKDQKSGDEEGQALSVSMKELSTKEHLSGHSGKRYGRDSDIGNLIDFLIHGMRLPQEQSSVISGEDKFGRSEEELVGTDDEELNQESDTVDHNRELSASFDKKLATLVSRASKWIATSPKAKHQVAVEKKLVAIAALLSRINKDRDKLTWASDREPFFQQDVLQQLFQALCAGWLEKGFSFEEVLKEPDQDEWDLEGKTLLNGFAVWLAWNTGIGYRPKAAFAEDLSAKHKRNWSNAVCFMLAQKVARDAKTYSRASELLSEESRNALEWLRKFKMLGDQIIRLKQGLSQGVEGLVPTPGYIAFHKKKLFTDGKLVVGTDGGKIMLASVEKPGNLRNFTKDFLWVGEFSQ